MTTLGNIAPTANLLNEVIATGTVIAWAATSTPAGGFLLCDGAPQSTTTYSALSAVVGTSFNAAGGLAAPPAGTFRTPPLVRSGVADSTTIGRTPIAGTPGSSGGAWLHGHSSGDLTVPSHTHGSDGPDGRMRSGHGHGHSLSCRSHYHQTSNYWYREFGGKGQITWVDGWTGGTTSSLNGGIYGETGWIYGDSASGGGGIGGSLTEGKDGPYTGINFWIKT